MPSCPLRSLTGVPCPLCGMTRGVEALVHGDVAGSLLLNPGALLLVALVVVSLGILFVQRRPRMLTVPAWSAGATFAGLWGWQLFKYSTGRPL